MKQESSAINPYNGMFGQQGWICPSVEGYIHLLPKCVCIANPIIQIQFLIQPSVKKN